MSSVTPAADGDPAARPLRKDAERNRARILAAAREVFAAQGLDAGFDEVARVAGVGVGTVYRRFPERRDLVEALFQEEVDAVVARAEEAAADPDPWRGLVGFLHWGAEAQAADRGLAQVLAAAGRGHERVASGRDRLAPAVDALVRHAQRAGVLRPDVSGLDIGIAVAMVGRVGGPDRARLRERYVTLVLDGLCLRRDAPTPLPQVAVGEDDLACVVEPVRRPR
ncbi:TetR/AcrR family transcriptional regulator [Klenkia taihuensis]|uniref:Transcriptional regulator, TetR family n=1 Tax=Klenkia taihuensis TaxID=1225127 RepID=A0A1I1NKL7_9ACTN|nr:TetR/AcrR family transcriptional regulator [Klenkia taihuensis]GHE11896.1 TetR family transcriptional regulator [Klenkia taihuensis]SFC97966.1 transcriptional regulator, TetR family [Klenkia taihuensis]